MIMKIRIFTNCVRLSFCLLLLIVLACATTGPGGKKSLIFIGADTEQSIGHEMDSTVRIENRILNDAQWQEYVTRIGNSIVAVCDRKDIEYHFAIIDSNMVNAFAAPGGYVYFYTGLLKSMDNEAEFAAVAAHEISHLVGRHSIKRLQTTMGVSLLEQLVFGQNADALTAAVNVGLGLAFAAYSRSDESEADNFGIQYMIKAGYDPNAAVTMFEKLATMSQGDPSFFEKLSMSHPDTKDRIDKSKALINSLKPLPSELKLGAEKYKTMRTRLKK
jgi:predicted Zn-dependent protease